MRPNGSAASSQTIEEYHCQAGDEYPNFAFVKIARTWQNFFCLIGKKDFAREEIPATIGAFFPPT